MAGVAMQVLVLTILTFKEVKLIFGHPVYQSILYEINCFDWNRDWVVLPTCVQAFGHLIEKKM